jgi:hypothetical protein
LSFAENFVPLKLLAAHMKNFGKVLTFLALMCLYLLIAGGPGWRTLYGQKLVVVYGFGAVIALWFGGRSIGTLQPITMRPVFIALGAVMMIVMFMLMLGSRDLMKQLDRGANHHTQRTPRLRYVCIQSQWRGAAGVDRSAESG